MKPSKLIDNFLFCLKYPFWRATNVWTGKFLGYSFTWYDAIPEGWQKAFGKELSEEIKRIGKAHLKTHKDQKWKDILYWEDIKEKYGTLHLYAMTIKPIQDILDRYEMLSRGYCIECGKPARYKTCGWIEYVCEDCAKSFKPDRLKKLSADDIPEITKYEYKQIGEQYFDDEKSRDEEYARLMKNVPDDIMYYKEERRGIYLIIEKSVTPKKLDVVKEWGIDLEKIWGLK